MQNGSVYRDKKSGAWYVNFYEGGKRRGTRLNFYSECSCREQSKSCSECKKSAQREAAKIAEKRFPATPTTVDSYCTLREFWSVYKFDKATELNPSTLVNYTSIWRKYVEPALGDKKVLGVTRQDCSELLRSIARNNAELSRKTLQRIKAFMTALFNHAAEKWEMLSNPASGKLGKIGSTEEKRVVPYSKEEFDRFFAAIRKADLPAYQRHNALALLTLMRATSLSRSELLGLHWEDLDVVGRKLKIRRGRVQDCDEARLKTRDREREQDLPEWAFQQLQTLKAATEGEGSIFRGANRGPLNVRYFLRVVFEPILGPLGWRGFHASRHAFATDLAASNVPRATLQEMMGHRPGSSVTDEFYVHPTTENRLAALALLEQRKPN
jgi:integrase